ncbi:ATP-binding protein [Rhodococcoides fascians]|uniref:ATP-binding protein n=1 Tax=Rhodococcoides fascians TaxID=1828 RepID=UPI0011799837|nr:MULTISPECIES: LuxR C-terminal-related transcriptional regulator [Rhodococcus]
MKLVDASRRSSRFTCLTGPGGVGKTRLAVEAAKACEGDYRDGVVYVDVSSVADADALVDSLASVLDLRVGPATKLPLLLDNSSDLQLLLLLDSCERLDERCQSVLQTVVSQTSITIVATSRRSLNVDGGQIITVPPLSLPPRSVSMTIEQLQGSEAVELFLDRARLVRPGYEIAPSQAYSVATLCERVDGVPLALEMAASWIRALSVDQIIDRMDANSDFPRGRPGADPHHRTLEALTAGSFELCNLREQRLWTRLTVFDGSFDLPAVEEICADDYLERSDLLDLIASLVDQSVVVVDDAGAHSRYRLLHMIRDFGSRRFSGADSARVREAHLAYFDQLLSRTNRDLSAVSDDARLQSLESNYANFTSAIRFSCSSPRTAGTGLGMAVELLYFWYASGRLTEGRTLLRYITTAKYSAAAPIEQRQALCVYAYVAVLQSENRLAAKLLQTAATITSVSVDPFGQALYSQVLAMSTLGTVPLTETIDLLDQTIALYERQNDARAAIYLMDTLGVAVLVAAINGNSEHAQKLGNRGLELCESVGDLRWLGYIRFSLAVDHWMCEDHAAASKIVEHIVGYTRDRLLSTHCIELLAWCAERRNNHEKAATLFGIADRSWQLLGGQFSGFSILRVNRLEQYKLCRAALGEIDFQSAYRRGTETSWADVVSFVQSSGSRDDALEQLTRREREVAELIAHGLGNRQIASRLAISQRTVETHVEHILLKLGLSNRTLVARLWIRRG